MLKLISRRTTSSNSLSRPYPVRDPIDHAREPLGFAIGECHQPGRRPGAVGGDPTRS